MDKIMSLFSSPLGIHIVKLIYAALFLIAAGVIAKLIQICFIFIFRTVDLDNFSKNLKLEEVFKKAEIKPSVSEILGNIIFWAALAGSFVWIIYFFNFVRAIDLLRMFLSYLSINAVSAIFIAVLSIISAIFLSQIISLIGAIVSLPGYKVISKVSQYVVIIYGIVVSLDKLGISSALILSKLDIILGFFALAGAIAFGLGCKDLAESFLSNFLRNNK